MPASSPVPQVTRKESGTSWTLVLLGVAAAAVVAATLPGGGPVHDELVRMVDVAEQPEPVTLPAPAPDLAGPGHGRPGRRQ